MSNRTEEPIGKESRDRKWTFSRRVKAKIELAVEENGGRGEEKENEELEEEEDHR